MTEGGVSYVPQIARKIQTASVVPPGAFPDGSGPGSPEETLIPGWITAVNERESAAVLAEWAAIQEAEAQREAEEKACTVASECVAPEEAELYDPEGLASYKRTERRASELRKDATNSFILGLVVGLVVDGVGETAAAYAEQLNESAENLEECVKQGKHTQGARGRWGTCFINEYRLPVGLFSVPWFATAEFCGFIGEKRWGKKSHNLYECEASGVVRWGPWFK